MSTCTGCGRHVLERRMRIGGAEVVVDALPHEAGTLALLADGVHVRTMTDGRPPRYRIHECEVPS